MPKSYKQLNNAQTKLIRLLADGGCHSESFIGTQLWISRTAVCKNIQQLIQLGIPIQHLPNVGYQLIAPMQLLDEQHIRQHLLQETFNNDIRFHLFANIPSTNRYLKDLPRSPFIEICCAEMQTQGRGRFGRSWFSPFGENIYFSMSQSIPCPISNLSGLSLVISLAIMACLRNLGFYQNIDIKWPNDILHAGRKLCGILVEIDAERVNEGFVVIGIGLNVNKDMQQYDAAQPWTSLWNMSHVYQDRNIIVAHLIIEIHRYLQKFLKNGLPELLTEWSRYDGLYNKDITAWQGNHAIVGRAKGINATGQLILEDTLGNIHYLSSGEVSVRKSV